MLKWKKDLNDALNISREAATSLEDIADAACKVGNDQLFTSLTEIASNVRTSNAKMVKVRKLATDEVVDSFRRGT